MKTIPLVVIAALICAVGMAQEIAMENDWPVASIGVLNPVRSATPHTCMPDFVSH